ncbi:DUF4124 domain-containing protein [Lysobacter xanthus]
MRRFFLLPLALSASLATVAAPAAKAPAQVTIYRCTDARGHLALRDSPCRAGERQETRSMLRPTDAPARARATPSGDRSPAMLPPTRVVYRTAPRPVYDCTTPDGARYTSASPEGNPRWVPGWTLGYPPVVYGPAVEGGYGGVVEHRGGGTLIRVEAGRRWRGPVVVGPPVALAPAGMWVRDVCAPLPAEETCDLLHDRREALDRRWFSALQGDRDAIGREQRRIDAELAESCR